MFGAGKSKEKVGRKSLGIAGNLLVQPFYRNTVEFGQVRIQNYFLITQN